jgi:hypothetical protein
MKSATDWERDFTTPVTDTRLWDTHTLDSELARNRPFSDPSYLFDCTVRRYTERLKMLAFRLPAAADAAAALVQAALRRQQQILGDPIVRAAINQALANISFGESSILLQEMGEIIAEAASLLRSDTAMPVLQIGNEKPDCVRFFGRSIWFWQSEHKDDHFFRLFSRIYQKQEGGKSVLVTPLRSERQSIIRAINLLTEIVPKLTESVLHHVNLICICDVPASHGGGLHFTSFTTIIAPGTVFLARSLLSNTWLLAEAILHEALHTKLYDFQHTHSLFVPKDPEMTAPIVCALWNRAEKGENHWPLNRSLFAFHVYVHLAIYFRSLSPRRAEMEAVFGPCGYSDLDVCARRAFDRAHYLEHHIAKCSKRLGAAGNALLCWLRGLLLGTDPAPPEQGAYLHLVIDLYRRETQQIMTACQKKQGFSATILPESAKQLEQENILVQKILEQLGISACSLHAGLSPEQEHLSVEHFGVARERIAQCLERVSARQAECKMKIAMEENTVGQFIQALVLNPTQNIARI